MEASVIVYTGVEGIMNLDYVAGCGKFGDLFFRLKSWSFDRMDIGMT